MDLRYPEGRFALREDVTDDDRRRFIEELEEMPGRLRAAVERLSDAQLETPYREGGWTVRQVVHHLADSHLNSYIRCKLALTEDQPTVKPYQEDRWAELADGRTAPVELSLRLVESLHARWVMLFRSLAADDFTRTFRHPEIGVISLSTTLGLYAWHGRHHISHITSLRAREGWR
jgi:uncharacterized damage-inducible protein DinB